MSLQLRAAGQEILNKYDLEEFHVRVNGQKLLTISSQCGKPLITVTGIQFSKNTPSKSEIPLALELLEAFLRLHRTTIAKYFNILGNAAQMQHRLENNSKFKGISSCYTALAYGTYRNDEDGSRQQYKFTTDISVVCLNMDIIDYKTKDVNVEMFTKSKLDKIVNTLKDYRSEFIEVVLVQKLEAAVLAELNECEI